MAEHTGGLHRLVTFPAIYTAVQTILGGHQSRTRIADALFSGLENRTIVEIGCGPGKWSQYLQSAARYLGVDHNARHIDTAVRQFGSEHTQFFCGDISDPAIIDRFGKVDCVVGIGILHHLDDDVAIDMLANVMSILQSGGQFIGIEPVYHMQQNPIARLLKKMDSGKNIRSEQGYRELFSSDLDMKTELRKDILRVPYSHCIITAKTS